MKDHVAAKGKEGRRSKPRRKYAEAAEGRRGREGRRGEEGSEKRRVERSKSKEQVENRETTGEAKKNPRRESKRASEWARYRGVLGNRLQECRGKTFQEARIYHLEQSSMAAAPQLEQTLQRDRLPVKAFGSPRMTRGIVVQPGPCPARPAAPSRPKLPLVSSGTAHVGRASPPGRPGPPVGTVPKGYCWPPCRGLENEAEAGVGG